MPPTYLRHSHRYCLGYCSHIREHTEFYRSAGDKKVSQAYTGGNVAGKSAACKNQALGSCIISHFIDYTASNKATSRVFTTCKAIIRVVVSEWLKGAFSLGQWEISILFLFVIFVNFSFVLKRKMSLERFLLKSVVIKSNPDGNGNRNVAIEVSTCGLKSG